MGTTLAVFQILGNAPVSTDSFAIIEIGTHKEGAQFFSKMLPKPSGPVALLTSKELSIEKTKGGFTLILLRRQSVNISLSAATSVNSGWCVKSSVDCSTK